MEKLGLGYEDCKKVKPDIIYLVSTVNGSEGPDADEIGTGVTVVAMAGLTGLGGRPDMKPVGTGTSYSDHVTVPSHSAFAILAALRHRRRTGRGQVIDVAQVETTTALLGPIIMDYTVNGNVQTRNGNRVAYAAPHGVYPCAGPGADRWIAIATASDDEWRALAEELGATEWTADERFATLAARHEHSDELDEAIAAVTRQQDAYELMESLQRRHVMAGVMQTSEDLVERDPQEKFRGHFAKSDHPEMGPSIYDSPPYHLSGITEPVMRTPAPLLGQHTYEVLGELLGMSKEEVDRLTEEGVLT